MRHESSVMRFIIMSATVLLPIPNMMTMSLMKDQFDVWSELTMNTVGYIVVESINLSTNSLF